MPFTVIVWFPKIAFLPTTTDIVDTPEPGAAIGLGLKVTACPLPWPVAVKWIAELKAPVIVAVMVVVPVPLLEAVIDVGDALMEKLPCPLVTFTVTEAVLVVPPAVPVTVIL